MNQLHVIAVTWFNISDWDELKTLCTDLQDTHAEWRANVRRQLKRQGLTERDIKKVLITPDLLRAAGATTVSKIDAKGRATLAAKIASKNQHH